MKPAGKGVSGGSGKRRKRPAGLPSERKLLLRLCLGLEAQTEAISRLAASNEALVDSLMEAEQEDGDGIPRTL